MTLEQRELLIKRWAIIGQHKRQCHINAGYEHVANLEAEFFRDTILNGDPTNAETAMSSIENELPAIIEDIEINAYKGRRRKDYHDEGLTFDSFVEMIIENDVPGMAQFRAKRDVIKGNHPKPKG